MKAIKNKCVLMGYSVFYRPRNVIQLYFHYNEQEFIVLLTKKQLSMPMVMGRIKFKCSLHNIPFGPDEKLIKKIEKILEVCK